MLYYSDEARRSAISTIRNLKAKVNEIPGNYISYAESSQLTSLLSMLEREIAKEGNIR